MQKSRRGGKKERKTSNFCVYTIRAQEEALSEEREKKGREKILR
jgi:hypothetical protein